jgi:MFS family permease
MLIVPAIVSFFVSKWLSLAEIFYRQAVFATTLVLLEAPSGYFADLFGRRNALMVGSLLHGLDYLVLNYADNIRGRMAFEIVLGIAASFVYEPPYQQAVAAPHRIKIIEVMRHLFMQDPLLRKIVIAIPIHSLATFNVAWLIQPYWEEKGMSLAMFGLLWCAQKFTTAITTHIGIERRLGAAMTLGLIVICP